MSERAAATPELPDDLRERIAVAADRLAVGLQWDPDDLIDLGVEMLMAGFDGESVVGLASFSPGERWVDVELVARAAIEEVGMRVPRPQDAGWVLALYWARQLRLGGPETYRRAAAPWGLWWTLKTPAEIGLLVEVMDEWEVALPGDKDGPELELQALAAPIIALAERRLSGRGNAHH